MKKTFRTILAGALALLTVSCYDDSALRDDLEDVEDALSELKAEFEEFKTKLNSEISTLQTSYNTLNASFTEYKGLTDQQVLTLNTALDALKAQVGVDDNSGIRKSVADVLAALNAYKTEADGKITTAEAALKALEGADSSLKTQLENLSAQLGTKADAQTLAALVETVESITVRSIAEDDKGNIVITLANNQTLTVAKDGNGVVKVVDGEWVVSGPEGDVALGLPITQENLVFGLDYNTNELRYSVDGLSEWNANKEWIGTGIFVSGNVMGMGIISDVWVQEDKGIASVTIDGESYDFMLMADGASSTLDILSGKAMFAAGQTKTFDIKAVGLADVYVMSKPEGWRASISGSTLTVTAPVAENVFAEQEGLVLLHGTSEGGECKVAKLAVTTSTEGLEITIDVETGAVVIKNGLTMAAQSSEPEIGPLAEGEDAVAGALQFAPFYLGLVDVSMWEEYEPEMLMEYMARSAYDQFFTMGTYADDYKVDVINTSIKALYNKINNPYADEEEWEEVPEGSQFVVFAAPMDMTSGYYGADMSGLVYDFYNPLLVSFKENGSIYCDVSLTVNRVGADSYFIGMGEAYEVEDGVFDCGMESSFMMWQMGYSPNLGLEAKDAVNERVMLSEYAAEGESSPLKPGTTYYAYAMPVKAGKSLSEYTYENDFLPYVKYFTTAPVTAGGTSTVTIEQDNEATTYTSIVANVSAEGAEMIYYKVYASQEAVDSQFETDEALVADIIANGNFGLASGDVEVRINYLQASQSRYIVAVAVDEEGNYGSLKELSVSTKAYPYDDENIKVAIKEVVFDAESGKPTVTYTVQGATHLMVLGSFGSPNLATNTSTTAFVNNMLTSVNGTYVKYYPVTNGEVTVAYLGTYSSYYKYSVASGFNMTNNKVTALSTPLVSDLTVYESTK